MAARFKNWYKNSRFNGAGTVLKETFVYVSCFYTFTTFVVSGSICMGPSMLPSISSSGDFVIIDCFSHKVLGKPYEKGDVVVAVSSYDDQKRICKRITAVAQDIIPSPRHYPKPQSKLDNFIQVPIGHVYLEGDNPYNSTDSRTYGPVPVGLIKGKVICKLSLRDFPFIFSFISKYKPIYDDDGRLIPESPEEAEERTRNHENLMKIKRYNYNSFRYHLPSTTKNNENSTSNNEKETENTQNPSSESESSSSSTTPQPENVRPLPPSQLFNEENLFSQNDRLLNYIRDKSLIEAKINENKQRFYQYEDLVMKKLNEIESFQLLNSSEKKFRFKDNHIRLQNEKLKQLNESKTLENIQEEIIQKNKDITQLIIEQYSKEKSQQYLIHSNASSELDNKH